MEHRLIIGDTAAGRRLLIRALLRDICTRGCELGHIIIIPPGMDVEEDIPDTLLDEFERGLDELLES